MNQIGRLCMIPKYIPIFLFVLYHKIKKGISNDCWSHGNLINLIKSVLKQNSEEFKSKYGTRNSC